jgi:RNA polymerase sigma factor (sigma-70 family)
MDKPYIKDYSTIVSLISYEYSKRYRMIDRQDISQELWLWFATRPNKLRDWYDNFESKDRDKLVAKSLRNAALKFCTKEKAKSAGYEVTDNFYYQPQIIEEFLPYILNDSYMLPVGVNDVNYKPDRNSVAESNTWLAVRADISEAFETVEERHQNVLRLRYNSINTTLEQVGSELNISPDAARKRVDRAIQAMIDELGGKRPYTEYDHGNPEE